MASTHQENPGTLHEVGDNLFAYVHADGTWGWSNAGLIAAGGRTTMLVDTLFDHRLTQRMLDAIRAVTRTQPIDTLVNTHGDGDHCFGNALVPATRILATQAAVDQLRSAPPSLAEEIKHTDFGDELNPFIERLFGPFRFDEVELRLPTEVFAGALSVEVAGRHVELIEVGPAHTRGDAFVHVPDAGVVFAGDLLFSQGTPVTSAGSPSNWLQACERLLATGAHTFIPGHGPVTNAAGVDLVARYLRYVSDEAAARHAAGMTSLEAAFDIELGEFADLPDAERITSTVEAVYREIEPGRPPMQREEMLRRMVRWRAARG